MDGGKEGDYGGQEASRLRQRISYLPVFSFRFLLGCVFVCVGRDHEREKDINKEEGKKRDRKKEREVGGGEENKESEEMEMFCCPAWWKPGGQF